MVLKKHCWLCIYVLTVSPLTTDWGRKSPKTCYWAGGPVWRIFRPRSADQVSTLPPPPAEAAGLPGAGVEDPPPVAGGRPRTGGAAGETGVIPRWA
jgi:hypothetical protein